MELYIPCLIPFKELEFIEAKTISNTPTTRWEITIKNEPNDIQYGYIVLIDNQFRANFRLGLAEFSYWVNTLNEAINLTKTDYKYYLESLLEL